MNYSRYIDHTLLKPDATEAQIKKLCSEAKKYHFASICVNPCYVAFCKKQLKNNKVKVCTVIGFPLGNTTTKTKVFETQDAIQNGADEIDMVINISWLKQKRLNECINEIKQIKKVCNKRILKVIVETCLLTESDKVNACMCVNKSGVDFIKTSTGFSVGGATIKDIKLFKKHISKNVKIKASGGIKTHQDMINMIDAGANRIGTSKGVEIIK